MKSSPADKPHAARARYSAREIYIPRGIPEIETRKEKFDKLNRAVTALGGWVVSIPGDQIIVIECLPGSVVPDRLRDAGYDLRPADPPEGERIIAGSIVERLELSSSGAFEPATENSTKPIFTRTHAGICKVLRFAFRFE
jgi:hypothetical protein